MSFLSLWCTVRQLNYALGGRQSGGKKILLTCFQFAFRVVFAFFLERTLFGAAAPLLHSKQRQCELWSAFWYSFSLELWDKYTLVHVYKWQRDHEVVWVCGCNSDIKTDRWKEGRNPVGCTDGWWISLCKENPGVNLRMTWYSILNEFCTTISCSITMITF